MNFKIPHTSSKFEAQKKVKRALEDARPQLKGQATIDEERWEGNTLHFGATVQGKSITGTLEITDSHFNIEAKLPLMWRLFEGRIEKMISEQVKQMGK
jgi:hypothetical protein